MPEPPTDERGYRFDPYTGQPLHPEQEKPRKGSRRVLFALVGVLAAVVFAVGAWTLLHSGSNALVHHTHAMKITLDLYNPV